MKICKFTGKLGAAVKILAGIRIVGVGDVDVVRVVELVK
jgi:hypothetical protein